MQDFLHQQYFRNHSISLGMMYSLEPESHGEPVRIRVVAELRPNSHHPCEREYPSENLYRYQTWWFGKCISFQMWRHFGYLWYISRGYMIFVGGQKLRAQFFSRGNPISLATTPHRSFVWASHVFFQNGGPLVVGGYPDSNEAHLDDHSL